MAPRRGPQHQFTSKKDMRVGPYVLDLTIARFCWKTNLAAAVSFSPQSVR
jgi:hypothetical protein